MQPTPTVSRADVERVVRREYPAEQFVQVMAILDRYGTRKKLQPERARVHLAALKLAGGDPGKLAALLDDPDYRDLLAAAEYPGYLASWMEMARLPAPEQRRIVDADWAQYMAWLNRE